MKVFVSLALTFALFVSATAFDQKGKQRNRSKIRVSSTIVREVKPASARVGEQVKIEGVFGQNSVQVSFSGVAATIVEREAGEVKVIVPNGASSGIMLVKVGERDSVAIEYTILSDSIRITPPSTATESVPLELRK